MSAVTAIRYAQPRPTWTLRVRVDAPLPATPRAASGTTAVTVHTKSRPGPRAVRVKNVGFAAVIPAQRPNTAPRVMEAEHGLTPVSAAVPAVAQPRP